MIIFEISRQQCYSILNFFFFFFSLLRYHLPWWSPTGGRMTPSSFRFPLFYPNIYIYIYVTLQPSDDTYEIWSKATGVSEAALRKIMIGSGVENQHKAGLLCSMPLPPESQPGPRAYWKMCVQPRAGFLNTLTCKGLCTDPMDHTTCSTSVSLVRVIDTSVVCFVIRRSIIASSSLSHKHTHTHTHTSNTTTHLVLYFYSTVDAGFCYVGCRCVLPCP